MHVAIVLLITGFSSLVTARSSLENGTELNISRSEIRSVVMKSNPTCNDDNECGLHGRCRDRICVCDEGYVTWQESGVCSYLQESKLLAFLLSFFLGSFGVDWFFLSKGTAVYITAGIFKVITSCGCCAGLCARLGKCSDESVACSSFFACLGLIFACGSPIWWIVDWVRILANVFNDGNGAPLKPW